METKIRKRFVYHGLGFPLVLRDVELVKVRGDWVPNVDFNEMEEKMALAVPLRPGRLTGSEVRFLRLHLGLTLSALARRLGVTHQAVAKWEATGDQPTAMTLSTEKVLRLFVLERKGVEAELFRQAYASFADMRPRSRKKEFDLRARAIKEDRAGFVKACLA